MGIHHSQATMSAPGLDSPRSGQSENTFPNSNDVFLQEHGDGFSPLSKGRFEFICVCTNARLPTYFSPVAHCSALDGLKYKRKTNLLAEGNRLIDRTGDTCFGNFETGFARK